MRIAIVNDLPTVVEAMRRVVLSTGEHGVAWVAADGGAAVELCARERPDLILMDLTMPRMGGVEAIRRIMDRSPCPIVVVTAEGKQDHARIFEAMGAGALDVLHLPGLVSSVTAETADKLLAKIDTIRRLTGIRTRSLSAKPARDLTPGSLASRSHPASATSGLNAASPAPLVAIGASAGGPAALARILGCWPADFPAAVVIVQHVDTQFAPGLVRWLSSQTPLPVRLIQSGDRPQAGLVLVANGEDHLVFDKAQRLVYSPNPAGAALRPSVDLFFQSIVKYWPGDVIGVVLTGMGRDGARGLKMLREAGQITVAQDQATSTVYGMPKAAAELRAAREILPLENIGPRLAMLVQTRRRRPRPTPPTSARVGATGLTRKNPQFHN